VHDEPNHGFPPASRGLSSGIAGTGIPEVASRKVLSQEMQGTEEGRPADRPTRLD